MALDNEMLRAKAEAASCAADSALQEQEGEMRRMREETGQAEERAREAESVAACLRVRLEQAEREASSVKERGEAEGKEARMQFEGERAQWKEEREKLEHEVMLLKAKKVRGNGL